MKTIHYYGIGAMLFIIGAMIWIMQAVLWYAGLFCLVGGGAAGLIGLFRFFAPGYIQVSRERHNQDMERADRDLRKYVIALGAQPGNHLKFEASGTIEVTPITLLSAPTQHPALPAQAESLRDESELPTSVRYEDIKSQIPEGHALLGVSATGVETCDFADLMTMWINGASNSGKSNTVGLKIDEAIKNGRSIGIILLDPHARKPDSLYNKIDCYEDRFLMPVARTEDEMIAALQAFDAEFKRRLDLDVEDLAALPDVLLVVDEVQHICRLSEDITKRLKKISAVCGQESRGFGMFGWFISQNAIGLSWLRNVVLTVITHKLNMMNERIIACNDNRDLARSMDSWPKHGRVAVYGVNFEGFRVLQMPAFKPARAEMFNYDSPLQDLPRVFQPQQWEDAGRSSEVNGEDAGREKDTVEDLAPDKLRKFLNEAGKMAKKGDSFDSILVKFGIPPGGRANQNLKVLLDQQEEMGA